MPPPTRANRTIGVARRQHPPRRPLARRTRGRRGHEVRAPAV